MRAASIEAESADETALDLCRQFGMFESQRYAKVAEIHGFVAVRRGRFEEARRSYKEALLLTLRFGNAVAATSLRHNLAELELLLGDAARALELATAAADGARRMHFGRFEAISLTNVAACSLALNDAGGARNAAHDALDLAQGAYPWAAIVAIQHLATVAASGRGTAARRSSARLRQRLVSRQGLRTRRRGGPRVRNVDGGPARTTSRVADYDVKRRRRAPHRRRGDTRSARDLTTS